MSNQIFGVCTKNERNINDSIFINIYIYAHECIYMKNVYIYINTLRPVTLEVNNGSPSNSSSIPFNHCHFSFPFLEKGIILSLPYAKKQH